MALHDDYSLNDDGTITLAFETVTRVLRRPNLGQYRKAVEDLTRMRARVSSLSVESAITSLDLVVEWFDSVCVLLAGEGLPRTKNEDNEDVIDYDVLPSWLFNGDLISEMITHWQTSPNRRGVQ